MSLIQNIPNDVKVGRDIISTTFPAAITKFADSFNRLRVSVPTTIFSSNFLYDKDPNRWNEKTVGTASSSAQVNSGITLSATGTGGRIVRQSKLYIPYIPGKSQMFYLTGILNYVMVDGAVSRIGSYDSTVDKAASNNPDTSEGSGHFFMATQASGTVTIAVVQRSTVSSSGAVQAQTDTVINQSGWNIDKLDGTGDSKVTIDFTKANVFIIERVWLGVGTVRFGVAYGSSIIWCHAVSNESINSGVYMATATLPIRYEIENNGANASVATLLQLACQTHIEGDVYALKGVPFGYCRTSSVSTNSTTEVHLLTLQINPTRPRAFIKFVRLDTTASTGAAILAAVFVRFNSVLTGTSFASVTNSSIQVSTAATITTPGTLIKTILIAANGSGATYGDFGNVMLGSGISSASPDYLTFTVALVSGTTATSANMAIDWEEL